MIFQNSKFKFQNSKFKINYLFKIVFKDYKQITYIMTDSNSSNYRLPDEATLKNVAKLSIVEDKPILFDYWTASIDKTALIGGKDNNEKLLVKSEEEYTSTIVKLYKSKTEYIIITENSIYVVDSGIPSKKIS